MKKKLSFIISLLLMLTCTVYAHNTYVIPSGESSGIRIFTDGLSVTAIQKIKDINGNLVSPGQNAGIRIGDVILSAADIPLYSIEDLSDAINKNPDGIKLQIRRSCESLEINAVPAKTDNGAVKLGLWVRDSAAGIGTITYYLPDANSFAALGHGICDVDTSNILSVNSGNIQLCTNVCATKSTKGVPGELNGSFNGTEVGEVELNCTSGIFGVLNDNFKPEGELIRVAQRSEVSEGSAYIMTDAAGGEVECYSAEITKIRENSIDTKALVIKITDQRLLDITGGIIRGMSGAPILQNNMLVGAITHVFVNDPAKGYGILAQSMLDSGNL